MISYLDQPSIIEQNNILYRTIYMEDITTNLFDTKSGTYRYISYQYGYVHYVWCQYALLTIDEFHELFV
jgi:hypothetical protein